MTPTYTHTNTPQIQNHQLYITAWIQINLTKTPAKQNQPESGHDERTRIINIKTYEKLNKSTVIIALFRLEWNIIIHLFCF